MVLAGVLRGTDSSRVLKPFAPDSRQTTLRRELLGGVATFLFASDRLSVHDL